MREPQKKMKVKAKTITPKENPDNLFNIAVNSCGTLGGAIKEKRKGKSLFNW